MSTLYVTEPGARIEKEYNRLLVRKEDEVLTEVPLAHVSEVVLVGGVGTTTPALLALLDAGVSLSLVTRTGELRGRLRPAESPNLPLRRAQYALGANGNYCLAISRQVVLAKLLNSRVLAMRILRKHDPGGSPGNQAALQRLEQAISQAGQASCLDELRGIEGTGAQAYFQVLRFGLKLEAGLDFGKRSRRPPRDPVNALLSLGYTLLKDALFTAVEVAGLDPYAGFFHQDKYNRPALVLDLMEEFRPLIADSVVLTLVNKRMLNPKDFTFNEDGSVYLNARGRRVFFRAFIQRLNTRVYHPVARRAITYQKCLEVQARQLRKVIEGTSPVYTGMKTR